MENDASEPHDGGAALVATTQPTARPFKGKRKGIISTAKGAGQYGNKKEMRQYDFSQKQGHPED